MTEMLSRYVAPSTRLAPRGQEPVGLSNVTERIGSVVSFVMLFACSVHVSLADDVEFTVAPTAVRSNDKVVISFSVNQPIDVEVSVRDAKGETVRHLAAGVLGGTNPPPPPLKPGLSQAIEWDGKDDLGKSAAGGPFAIRVCAGMRVEFGRMIGGSAYTGSVVAMPYRAPVNGLAVDVDGGLYVKMMSSVGSHGNSGMWPWHLRKFDREGNYLKTVLPYPPSTAPARATGVELVAS